MDRLPNPVEEAIESVNPKEQGLPASNPYESFRSERHAPAELNEKESVRKVICKRYEKKGLNIEQTKRIV